MLKNKIVRSATSHRVPYKKQVLDSIFSVKSIMIDWKFRDNKRTASVTSIGDIHVEKGSQQL